MALTDHPYEIAILSVRDELALRILTRCTAAYSEWTYSCSFEHHHRQRGSLRFICLWIALVILLSCRI